MPNPHKRKKQPEIVRQSLLEHAARIVLDQGIAAMTMQAVAEAAGVSKGGLIHHFPSKKELVEALFDDVMDDFDREVERLLATDPGGQGCFTRAYIDATLNMLWAKNPSQMAVLSILMLSDAHLRQRWNDWIQAREKRHATTDSTPHLQVMRLAADGLWLARLSAMNLPPRAELRDWFLASLAANKS